MIHRLDQHIKANRRKATWVLWVAAVIFVPVPYFMLVIGGLIPVAAILYWTLQGAIVGLSKLTQEAFSIVGILTAHVLVFGGLLYLLSSLICRFLYLLFAPRRARIAVLLLAVTLAAASLFEIYRLPGHNSAPPANIVGVFHAIV
jgi:hypothetical protein